MNAPEGGLYRPLVLCLSLLLVAAGALLSIQMISAIVGPFRLADIGVRDPRSVIALWRPLGSFGSELLRGPLGHELVASGCSAHEVTALAGLDPARIGAIVLPEPRALTARDLAELDAYLEAGGGAVLLGSIAVRNPDGSWRGYEQMQRLLGARIVELDERSATALVADRRGPLSSVLGPREQIGVAFEPGTSGVLADEAELRWAGAEGKPGPAAAIRRTRGKGRFVWIAAAPERAMPSEDERRRARKLVEVAVAWVSRTPSVEILPWPRGAAYAAVVTTAESVSAPEASWQRELAEARRDAGVAKLRVPREHAARDSLEAALAQLLAEVGRSGWVASRPELSSWMRSRAVVDASVRRVGPRRLAVEVSNRGAAIEDVVLRVHLNEPILSTRVQGTELLQADARAVLAPDGEALDLVLPKLTARASMAWNLDIEPALRDQPGGER